MLQRIRVLILEDRATDAELAVRELRHSGFDPEWRRVQTEDEFVAALDAAPDVILADYSLPCWDAPKALTLVQARGCDIPFIVVSGTIGEDAAVAMMRQGAADYLLKDRLARLGPAVRQAIERRRLLEERRALANTLYTKEARFRTLIEKSWDLLVLFSEQWIVEYISPATPHVLGYGDAEVIDRSSTEFIHPDDQGILADAIARSIEKPGVGVPATARVRHKDGSYRVLDGVFTNLLREPSVGAIVLNYRDITERVRAERVLIDAREQLQRAVTAGNVGLWDWDLRTNVAYYSPEWKGQIGYGDHEIGDSPEEWRSRLHPDDLDRAVEAVQAYLNGTAAAYEEEFRFRHRDGSYRNILARATKFVGDDCSPVRLAGSHVDITDRAQLQAQFLQAQKMELVGRLAGGIAHDFNNLITVINATADLAMTDLRQADPLRADLQEILRAGERATSLTRQLLAFSRR